MMYARDARDNVSLHTQAKLSKTYANGKLRLFWKNTKIQRKLAKLIYFLREASKSIYHVIDEGDKLDIRKEFAERKNTACHHHNQKSFDGPLASNQKLLHFTFTKFKKFILLKLVLQANFCWLHLLSVGHAAQKICINTSRIISAQFDFFFFLIFYHL